MKSFRVLIYEDSEAWKKSFEFNLQPKLFKEGIKLIIRHQINSNLLSEDVEFLPHVIMIDYDLGEITGVEVLDAIDGDQQFSKTSIILYSGGESVDNLKNIAKKYKGGVACYSKDGDDLENSVLKKGRHLAK